MSEYTNKRYRVRTHNYKKKVVTCDLKVVIFVAVRAMWEDIVPKMVPGTNDV